MKNFILVTLIFCATLMISPTKAQSNSSSKMLRHVVLFKFKDTSSAQEVKVVENAFVALNLKRTTCLSIFDEEFDWAWVGEIISAQNIKVTKIKFFIAVFLKIDKSKFYD